MATLENRFLTPIQGFTQSKIEKAKETYQRSLMITVAPNIRAHFYTFVTLSAIFYSKKRAIMMI